MKKLFILFISLSVIFIFTQCRTTRTGVDGTTSSTIQQTSEKKLTDSPIDKCTYFTSSPFFGRKEWSVTNQYDGHYKVVFKQMTNMGNDMPVELEFTTDSKINDDLHKLFREANLQNCKPVVPDPEMRVYDAPAVFFSVKFVNRTEYSNKELYENSPEVINAMSKADNYVMELVKEHRK